MTPMLPLAERASRRPAHALKLHDKLIDVSGRVGPVDRLASGEVLDLLRALPVWPQVGMRARYLRIAGAGRVLDWLLGYPGDGWQDRWVAAGADEDRDRIDQAVAGDPRAYTTKHKEVVSGLCLLLLCRVVLPSHRFLATHNAQHLFSYVRQVFRPDLFAKIEENATKIGVSPRRRAEALSLICKIVLNTGRDVDQLTAEDLFAYRAWSIREYGSNHQRIHLAWVMLRGVADLGEHTTLQAALRFGQRPTAELVDAYHITCRTIRDVLIRYLDERRPALDYASLTGLTGALAGNFWADIQTHHPGIDTLRLPHEVAQAWKQRMKVVTGKDGTTRPRKNHLALLVRVRAFYLDIQQWALEDPSWVPWAVPSPVRRGDLEGMGKHQKKTTAAMHQRVRERLPHLPVLIDTSDRHRTDQAELLAAATATASGQTFTHHGREFRRSVPHPSNRWPSQIGAATILVEDMATTERIDLTRNEDEAFWAWAIIETLRHTGVRIEELTEITHLALISYRLPDTGEVVPMLQILPSKNNEERLLLVSPELASVLATIITRLRHNDGTIPLVTRYDGHERITGPALPHLFQRRFGWRNEVPSSGTVQKLLNQTLERAGLLDNTGAPLHYTPHDFRRMFATEAVTGGLPVHIAARLLGHATITTTQAYLAVFHDDLVRTYRTFLDKRRATRPEAEYREPTEQEWQEFQQHFQARKLELGECGRPYGTPCKHEHACIRCPSLRLDPTARPRLAEIITNLNDRIAEAKLNGWLGEVAGLNASVNAAARKLVSLDRMRQRQPSGPINLGIPIITDPTNH